MAEKPNETGKGPTAGENFAHPLYQLLGAPLLALVQAESQAALATAEFIQKIGFEAETGTEASTETQTTSGVPATPDAFGNMRMATFSNQVQGPDGKLKTMNIQVPLLSLVPIPALQIKDADLEFYVRILDFSKNQSSAKISTQKKVVKEQPDDKSSEKEDFLSPNQMQFRASMGRGPGNSQYPSTMEAQIKIKIKMAQADIPVGLARLFNIMDQSVSVTPDDSKQG